MEVSVVGGGVAGLGAALALARRGHAVTVFERDDTPMPQSADEAFDWDRRGAPQVRHSHAFLARLVCLLKSDYPDVHQQLIDEGATEMRFGEDLPPTMVGFLPEPQDDDLSMLACRRTTFEWVLRRAALAEGRVEFRTGIAVDGLVAEPAQPGARPHVRGVRLADGGEASCDLVVVAAGRRSALPEWLVDIGCDPIDEEVDDTGIVYFSRFYRLLDGAGYPPRTGPIGGDLGYLKYGVFVGDNRTFSVTLATPTDDQELRKLLADPDVFDSCARQLVATAPYLDGRAEPITASVHVMAGLINRWRQYVVGERAVATGFIAIGDAVLCTNPLYGRGCATAFWGAHLMVEAIEAHPGNAEAMLLAYEVALRSEIYPWYRASVEQDAEGRRVAAALLAGEDPDGDPNDQRAFMRAVFRDGLLPALRRDPVVLRAFFRSLNLLTAPDAMIKDPDVGARVLAVWQDRDNRPPEPALGPKRRADLLALLT
ncbi:MAG TPA: FAD-dependent oxidoreductase [Ilumatobacteraceae bacterium]|jgi:2-polyprenyl-6-methoxyphenol hydroxylase-like FAD-dependent oxidoreductase|nr:FAD-dependent oxidoreductase [Ilumatobacteraceae bacterium]